jgi:methyl-accepting chemotaxis protein
VADEVKALARQTGDATGSIEKHIQQIDAAAALSSVSLQRLLEVIAGVDRAASEIFQVTDAQVVSTRELTERITAISTSTRSVATDIRDAQETAHTTEQMSTDMVKAAAVIEDQTDQLREQVGRFVMGLRNAGAGAPTSRPSPSLEADEPEQWRAVAS